MCIGIAEQGRGVIAVLPLFGILAGSKVIKER